MHANGNKYQSEKLNDKQIFPETFILNEYMILSCKPCTLISVAPSASAPPS